MDFRNGRELLELCDKSNQKISEIMKEREISQTESTLDEINYKMSKALEIMKESAKTPLTTLIKSMGGLIGGESAKLHKMQMTGKNICGTVLSKAITYSMSILEVNSSMGVIVATPTAGSSGVVPGVLLALQEEYNLSDEKVLEGLFTAGAIGYLFMRNGSVAGAEIGCQGEVGVAAAMGAGAIVEIMGGTPEMVLNAATIATMNLLGLVCDPVGGLVESPCQSRNAIGASNALICAEMSLAGIKQMIFFDEIVDTLMSIGRSLPAELRETGLGGCAATPTGYAKAMEIFG